MAFQYIVGSTNSGKSTALYKKIMELAAKDFRKKYIVIVPEQFTMQTQRALVDASAHGCIMNVDVLSFNRLALRVFEETGEKKRMVLEDTGKNMIIRRLLSDVRGRLSYFSNASKKNGFTEDMKSLITELFQYNISSEKLLDMENNLKNAPKKDPVLTAKLADTRLVLDAFNAYKADKYITAEEILDLLIEVLPESKMLDDAVVAFDGFTGFTPAQLDLIRVMSHRASDLLFTVSIDPLVFTGKKTGISGLFSLSLDTLSRLDRISKEEGVPLAKPFITGKRLDEGGNEIDSRPNTPAIRHLSDNIFRYPVKRKKLSENENSVSINVCIDPHDEAKFVLSEIKRLVIDEGYRYRDIGVVAGDISIYGEIIVRTLNGGGVPCFLDQKRNIMANPLVEFVRSALAIINEEFSVESVMRFLRSSLADVAEEDIDIFENFILEHGIRGRKRYKETFLTEKRLARFSEDEYKMGLLRAADRVRAYIDGLFTPLYDAFADKDKTARSLTMALYDLVLASNCASKMDKLSSDLEKRNEPILAKESSQCYRLVLEIFEKMADLLGNEHISTEDYVKVMESGFSEQEAGFIPPGQDQVLVGDLVRTRLPQIKVLFALGFNDGIVPASTNVKGILTDREREKIFEAGFELAPTVRERSKREQFYIYMNLSKPANALYICYSKNGADGSELKPSYFIDRISAMYDRSIVCDRRNEGDLLTEFRRDMGRRVLISSLNGLENNSKSAVLAKLYEAYDVPFYKSVLQGHNSDLVYNSLKKAIAEKLYENLTGSVSRLELFASCPFAHFMTYGLYLKERRYANLSLPDLGTIYHAVLENFERKTLERKLTFRELAENDSLRNLLADESVDAVTGDENNILHSSERLVHIIDRIKRVARRAIWAVTKQIAAGSIEPLLIEEQFVRNGMTGRIDRVDLFSSDILPDGKKLSDITAGPFVGADTIEYVRVIDYKTGNKSFDLNRIYYGLDLQLFTYVRHVKDKIKELPGKNNAAVVPEGAFYFHIDDPVVEKGEGKEAILKKLRLNGPGLSEPYALKLADEGLVDAGLSLNPSYESLVLSAKTTAKGSFAAGTNLLSAEHMELVTGHVDEKEKDLKRLITNGDVRPYPFHLGGKSGCDYCPYNAACRFDPKISKYRYNYMKEMSDDDIFMKIRKEGGEEE